MRFEYTIYTILFFAELFRMTSFHFCGLYRIRKTLSYFLCSTPFMLILHLLKSPVYCEANDGESYAEQNQPCVTSKAVSGTITQVKECYETGEVLLRVNLLTTS